MASLVVAVVCALISWGAPLIIEMVLPPAIGGYRGLLGSLAETVISKVFSLAVMVGPLVALGLGIVAYRRIQAGKAYGMRWAISGILVASVDMLLKLLFMVALLAAHWPH